MLHASDHGVIMLKGRGGSKRYMTAEGEEDKATSLLPTRSLHTKAVVVEKRAPSSLPGSNDALGRVDPNVNYLIEYRKERIGKMVKASKCEVTLAFVVEGVRHSFTVKHSTVRGKYSIYLDGTHLMDYSNIFDSGIVYHHKEGLEGRAVTLMVVDKLKINPFVWAYKVFIDGEDAKKLADIRDALYIKYSMAA